VRITTGIMEEIKDFAKDLEELTGYRITNEDNTSRVVLLSNKIN
jgi:wyosine [tRNA(Phe)-imidazoG37] synthetase (radical SAM superfamily)